MDANKKKAVKEIVLTSISAVVMAAALVFTAKTFVKARDLKKIEGGANVLTAQTISEKKDPSNGEYGDYAEISQQLAKLKSTNEVWTNIDEDKTQNGFFCISKEDTGAKMIYNISVDKVCGNHSMKDFNYIWVDSVNSGFYCVLNIAGEVVDLTDYYILVHDDSGNLASRLVINCYEAKAVKLGEAIVTGTLLAPNANVEYNQTVVYGGIYAKGSTGMRAFYKEIPFGGYDEVMVESVPVSFTNYMMHDIVLKWLKTNIPSKYSSYTNDYVLTTHDLSRVTALSLDGELIADLFDDLKYMVNLETLSLSKTRLTNVDLSYLAKLKSLDISNTGITSVTLPKTVEKLIMPNTKIETLDTAAMPNLKELDISGNTFAKAPDYSKLARLEKLTYCNSNFTGFSSDEKKALANLTYLDVSSNAELTSFDATAFTKLKTLIVRECKISSLKVNENKALEEIDISYNSLGSPDLSGCKSLKKVSAYGSFSTVYVASDKVQVGKLASTKVQIK